MKNYLVFIISFILLYFVSQIVSGMVLTILYVPDISTIEGNYISNKVSFGQYSVIPMLVSIFAATLAYLISKKYIRHQENNG